MPWFNVMLNRMLSEQEVVAVMKDVLDVKGENIKATKESIVTAEIDEHLQVFCWLIPRPGDFPLDIEVIYLDEKLPPQEAILIADQICGRLECLGLVIDRSSNPYSYILLSGRSKYQHVIVDDVEGDEADGVQIISFLEHLSLDDILGGS